MIGAGNWEDTGMDEHTGGGSILGWRAALSLMPGAMWLSFLAVGALIATAFAVNVRSTGAVRDDGRQIEELMRTQNELNVLRADLVDIETGLRGYLLTGQEAFLEPYKKALQAIPFSDARLRYAATNDPELSKIMSTLDAVRRLVFRKGVGQKTGNLLLEMVVHYAGGFRGRYSIGYPSILCMSRY